MPTEPEAVADHGVYQLGACIDELLEAYRDHPDAARILTANADLIEEAYRRLGNLVHLIRPRRAA